MKTTLISELYLNGSRNCHSSKKISRSPWRYIDAAICANILFGMEDEMHIVNFVSDKCEAVKESKEFVDEWFDTNGNPCSVCHNEKSKCSYYNELVEKGVV